MQTVQEEGEPVNRYTPIADSSSAVLGLRLQAEEKLIGFYRIDNGWKLPISLELVAALCQAADKLLQAEQRAADLAEKLRAAGIDPDSP
ncbi:hypothetical protein [Gloeobacter morelensis]|uniref:Uncharacterized protein n=1 Tax=Gloeobacter morelensis MG652769 TaxID=2781736 RepID=A0ABY3PLK4_9CYAN|nr:hypothetical protein [Gloeobacter morelensis]UFP94474.1 hypothetical protein ISF26_22490 [Gloeobacter morelensis MG652769]